MIGPARSHPIGPAVHQLSISHNDVCDVQRFGSCSIDIICCVSTLYNFHLRCVGVRAVHYFLTQASGNKTSAAILFLFVQLVGLLAPVSCSSTFLTDAAVTH